MQLTLIHGINNVDVPIDYRLVSWRNALVQGGTAAERIDAAAPVMPDYARVLRDARVPQNAATFQRFGPTTPADHDKLVFMAGATSAMLAHWQSDVQAALAEIDPVADSDRAARLYGQLVEGGRPRGLIGAVEIFDEIYDYLTKPTLRIAIDAIVMAALAETPLIIIGHSLGSVVAWRLLRAMGAAGADLGAVHLATLGAPFPNPVLKTALDAPFEWPRGLGSWVNLYHPLDYVSLGAPFRLRGGDRQPNHHAVITGSPDPHDVRGYLRTAPLRRWLDDHLPGA